MIKQKLTLKVGLMNFDMGSIFELLFFTIYWSCLVICGMDIDALHYPLDRLIKVWAFLL